MARTKNSEFYNSEGYTDKTAFFGMYSRPKREAKTRDIRRGEIYYIAPEGKDPLERKNRPGIVVSNDQANRYSSAVEVVYLTSKEQSRELPSNVIVMGTGKPSIAICGKVHSVSVDRLGSYGGRLTDAEQKEIDRALMFSLGLNGESPERKNDELLASAFLQLTAERERANLYQKLYEQLLNRI